MTYSFLLDEDTEAKLAVKLSKAGHDVERVVEVPELGAGIDDDAVREYALDSARIIITHDKDYLRFPPKSHAGVFYGPQQRLSAHQIFKIIQNIESYHSSREELNPVIFLTERWLDS